MISDELNKFMTPTCEHCLDIGSLESKVLFILLLIDGLNVSMDIAPISSA